MSNQMEQIICLTSAYLAPIQYYSKLYRYPSVFIERHDNYIKQTYRNRCIISGPQGSITSTVPTIKPSTPKIEMKDVEISNHGNWRHLHWKAIESSYNNTPYYEHYKELFQPFYEQQYTYLFDFNLELQELICSLIHIQPNLQFTEEYRFDFTENELDFREVIHPKKESALHDSLFQVKPYYQVFSQQTGFIPNLSILDLLFHKGPEAICYL